MKGYIETKWGTKIEIDGMPEEVNRIIDSIHRREQAIAERYERRNDRRENLNFYHSNNSYDEKEKYNIMGPKKAIEKLIENDFFESPRSLSEIRLEIRNKFALPISSSSLHPTLQIFCRNEILNKITTGTVLKYQINRETRSL